MRRVQIKRGLVLTWMLSYVAILLISFICTMIIYGGYNNAFNTQAKNINQLASSAVSKNVEEILVSMRKIYFDISFNASSESLYAESIDDYYSDAEIIRFADQMYNYGRYKNNVDMFYLYVPKTDAVISDKGIVDSKTFFRTYIVEPQSYEEWISSLTSSDTQNYSKVRLRDDRGIYDAVSSYMPLIDSRRPPEADNAIIVAATNCERFFEGATAQNTFYPYDVFIYDKKERLVLWQNSVDGAEGELPKKLSDVYDYSDNKMVISNTVSFDSVEMTVATVFSKKVTLANLEYIRYLFLLVIIISLLISIFAISYFVRRNYRPLREIMDMLGIEEKKGEYTALRNSIEETLRSNSMMTRELKNQQLVLEKLELSHILRGRPVNKNTYFEKFTYPYYAVVMFSVHSIESMFDSQEIPKEDKEKELKFIISNIMEELLDTDETSACVVEVDETSVCVVNFSGDGETLLWDKLLYGVEFIENQFSVNISFGISSTYSSLGTIANAYNEALRLFDYKALFKLNGNLRYSEEFQENSQEGAYLWQLEREQLFLRYLNSGNYEMCEQLLRKVFDEIVNNQSFSSDYIKNLTIDIASTLLKGGATKTWNHQFLTQRSSIEELLEKLLEECRSICERNISSESNTEIRLCENVVLYVQQHYSDSTLCSDSIGTVFNMTGAYLSKKFKNATGDSLVNYITHYRLEKSKELIRTTRHNLNTISQMCGFSHIRTYNRLFKKYEDMTPSAYKERFGK